MIVLSITLLSFGSADLVRWSPDRVSPRRTAAAVLGALVVTLVPISLSGLPALDVALVEAGTLLSVLVWLLFDRPVFRKVGPGYQLAWIAIAVMVAFASSGATNSISGPLRHWYSSLPFGFVRTIGIDPFLLGVSAALFVLATANRIVRLVLQAAGTPAREGETTLSGGRILGPMERLFVAAMVVSGNLTAAAALIAAKGLLRLPEIRSSAAQQGGAGDQVTEYFLIGTFCSLLIASALGTLVSGSG
jgi:hypothetical protein